MITVLYFFPDNRLTILSDIVNKNTSEKLKDCDTAVYALIPDVEFPPLPGNAIRYEDTFVLKSVYDDAPMCNESTPTVASVYAATFGKQVPSLCRVILGTHYFMYGVTLPNPWWNISGDIARGRSQTRDAIWTSLQNHKCSVALS